MPAASSDAYQVLTDRIQKEFVSLLSPEDLKAIIDRELYDLNLTLNNRGEETKSPLQRAINGVLYELLREKVEMILNSSDLRDQLEAFITKSLQDKLGLST
jgi:hypothetical protein